MRRFSTLALALVIAVGSLAGCSTLISYYLVNELLNDGAPKFTWRGAVTDPENRGIAGLTVRIRATAEGDPNPLDFTGETSDTGHYQITYKWNDSVNYTVSVLSDSGAVLAERNIGSVSKGDQRDDFVVQGISTLEVSGSVRDAEGNPLSDVLIIGASSSTAGGTATPFADSEGETAFAQTAESGVYQLSGSSQPHTVVVAYHPDHGFAYATGQDTDEDGELGLDIVMGEQGQHDVSVQVVNGLGQPVQSQVLAPAQRFRLRMSTPYNLGSTVDSVVEDNELFGSLLGLPSDSHPTAQTLLVESTGANGIADDTLTAQGGTYVLTPLMVDSDLPATALVTSENPLPLGEDSTVVVRVN